VLAAQFESFHDPLIILAGSVPLALSGGLLFSFLGLTTLNICSQVGLITLVGLGSKNGVLIVEFANHLQEAGRTVPASGRGWPAPVPLLCRSFPEGTVHSRERPLVPIRPRLVPVASCGGGLSGQSIGFLIGGHGAGVMAHDLPTYVSPADTRKGHRRVSIPERTDTRPPSRTTSNQVERRRRRALA
jgi:hypothetical protein